MSADTAIAMPGPDVDTWTYEIEFLNDCNDNGVVDSVDIANGDCLDADANGRCDECQTDACVCEYTDDGSVSVADLLQYLDFWFVDAPEAELCGAESPPAVTVADLLCFLECWFPASMNPVDGPCS